MQMCFDFSSHGEQSHQRQPQEIRSDCYLWRAAALGDQGCHWLRDLNKLTEQASFRFMRLPSNKRMSVEMSNCGEMGWYADASGYRYLACDPTTGYKWPAMPTSWSHWAKNLAHQVGFSQFTPNSCLLNRYAAGSKMGLHQDMDGEVASAPIVSVSLGLHATFLLGGQSRNAAVQRLVLEHGDVLLWGGEARWMFHGVLPISKGFHPIYGPYRYNLTFRQVAIKEVNAHDDQAPAAMLKNRCFTAAIPTTSRS